MYTSVLATTDGSDGARRAVERAVELASLFNARLHFLFVVDTDQFSADKPNATVEALLDGLEADGEAVLRELEDLATGAGVDDVVMGTHGKSGYQSARLGNTAAEVARRVDEPLLLI